MEKEFIPYEQALALKELGFDRLCFFCYEENDNKNLYNLSDKDDFPKMQNKEIPTPLYQQAFRWFREKHNMLSNIYSNASGWCFEYHDNIGGTHRLDSGYTGDCEESGMFTTYEKAELACLIKLIELCKKV